MRAANNKPNKSPVPEAGPKKSCLSEIQRLQRVKLLFILFILAHYYD